MSKGFVCGDDREPPNEVLSRFDTASLARAWFSVQGGMKQKGGFRPRAPRARDEALANRAGFCSGAGFCLVEGHVQSARLR